MHQSMVNRLNPNSIFVGCWVSEVFINNSSAFIIYHVQWFLFTRSFAWLLGIVYASHITPDHSQACWSAWSKSFTRSSTLSSPTDNLICIIHTHIHTQSHCMKYSTCRQKIQYATMFTHELYAHTHTLVVVYIYSLPVYQLSQVLSSHLLRH